MAYRKRRGSRKFEAMRAARERLRLESEPEPRPLPRPALRREIIVISHEFGQTVEHRFQLLDTRRVDLFRVIVDGQELPKRMGWSRALELARKAFVRVGAR